MITILRRLRLTCLALAMLASSAAAQSGEWDTAAASYGRGVHAFFAGRYAEAEAWLSRAMAFDPNDPRLFYFRALSLMRLGRTDEACADMEIGASLESELPNRYAVGSALLRVQGCDRLLLEKFRREARGTDFTGHRISPAQFEQRVEDDSQVLHQQVVVPLDEFLRPGNPRALSSEELARRAAVAEARSAPRSSSQGAMPPASQPDPFQDDAPPTPPAPAASSTAEPAPPAEVIAPDKEEMPAEAEAAEPEAVEAPEPAAPGSDEDPFSDI